MAKQLRHNDCIKLNGTLGAGKTTFMRHLISALGHNGDVISPTFMLMQEYPVELSNKERTKIYHVDAYRIEDVAECEEIGLQDMLETGIVCIEWPEICADWLPKDALQLTLDISGEQRKATLIWPNRQTKLEGIVNKFNDGKA